VPGAYSADSFKQLTAEHLSYKELEKLPGWIGHVDQLNRMLKIMRQQLEWGTEDKFGRNHDDEKRAVIHVIETLMSYPAKVHERWEHENKRLLDEQARREQGQDGPIHGNDIPGPSLKEFLNT
jgi:hypothetical protein